MAPPPSQSVLAGIAMLILGGLSFLMVFFAVPAANHDFLVFILGALSGALTVGGAAKIASSGPNTTINAPPSDPQVKE